jgi:hypothetical protein
MSYRRSGPDERLMLETAGKCSLVYLRVDDGVAHYDCDSSPVAMASVVCRTCGTREFLVCVECLHDVMWAMDAHPPTGDPEIDDLVGPPLLYCTDVVPRHQIVGLSAAWSEDPLTGERF